MKSPLLSVLAAGVFVSCAWSAEPATTPEVAPSATPEATPPPVEPVVPAAPADPAVPSPSATPSAAPNDPAAEASARSGALELAGAFSNDGYKIRDGYWYSTLEADKPAILEVNLFTSNEYWFCAAANPPAREIAITIYDAAGNLVDQQDFRDGTRTASGVEPVVSGKYFVEVRLLEGDKSHFCLIYSYK